jgi:hypothetical protein
MVTLCLFRAIWDEQPAPLFHKHKSSQIRDGASSSLARSFFRGPTALKTGYADITQFSRLQAIQ